MDDKRIVARHRVLKAATMRFNGGGISCVVRNVSDAGAALDVASPLGIPEEFDLTIEADGFRRHCRVVWRTEKRIGVAFEPSA